MRTHEEACRESKELCKSLFDKVQEYIPEVKEPNETKSSCAMVIPDPGGGKDSIQFANVYHRMNQRILVEFHYNRRAALIIPDGFPKDVIKSVTKKSNRKVIKINDNKLIPGLAKIIYDNSYPIIDKRYRLGANQ